MSEDTERINSATTADASPRKAEAAAAEALSRLHPRDRAMVEDVMRDHPSLSIEKALEMLRYFGGL